MLGSHDALGRPIVPKIEADHVHVYSQDLQLKLGETEKGDKPFLGTRDFGTSAALPPASTLRPLLSPGPPLRGYAAEPLRPARAAKSRSPTRSPSPAERLQMQAAADEKYQQMMSTILERTKQRNQTQQQEEDRRMERLLKHIEGEQGFVEDLDRSLRLHDIAKYRQKVQLLKDWNEKVYGVIQRQIQEQLDAIRVEDISERRRKLLEDYIRVSNKKRYGLYRDIIIESEYDPMVAHKTLLKYRMSDAQDPLKIELNAIKEGDASKWSGEAGGVATSARQELGRSTLDATMWARLDATPYGRFDRVPAGASWSPRDGIKLSRVNMEHYDVERGVEVLDREFPRGKRIAIDGVRDQRRSTIFDAPKVTDFAALAEELA